MSGPMDPTNEEVDDILDRLDEAAERGVSLSIAEACRGDERLIERVNKRFRVLSAVQARLGLFDEVSDQAAGRLVASEPFGGPGAVRGDETVVSGAKSFRQSGVGDDELVDPGSDPVSAATQYRGLRYLDKGGMGLVYRGVDEQLHREVAVKFLKSKHIETPESVRRFREEAEITSVLDHPGVLPIFGTGVAADGRPFYAMRMIRGQPLNELIDELHADERRPQPLEMRKLLGTFLMVCRTIDYAHSRGVLHCDIKPQNVMVGQHGETVVLDWGLASFFRRADWQSSNNEDSVRIPGSDPDSQSRGGTPGFMSPEQYRAEPLGPPSDVYALGATLFRLLTGVNWYEPNSSLFDVRDRAMREDYVAPSSINPIVSPDLDAICRKAMRADPNHRYRSAAAFAEDIEAALADEPISAIPERSGRRISRWLRHHRRFVGVGVLGLVMLIGAILWDSVRVRELAASETQAKEQAAASRNDMLALASTVAAQAATLRQDERVAVLLAEAKARDLVAALRADDGAMSVRECLEELVLVHQPQLEATSWFVCDATGLQRARWPRGTTAGKKSFAFRDYFHGRGRDFDQDADPATIEHITGPHRSEIYESTNDPSSRRIALTVPIFDSSAEGDGFLGVLGMSIDVSMLLDFDVQLRPGQELLLVDLHENGGAVLQRQFRSDDDGVIKEAPVGMRLTPENLAELRDVVGGASSTNRSLVMEEFRAPSKPAAAPMVASASFVGNDSVSGSPLAVIVQCGWWKRTSAE